MLSDFGTCLEVNKDEPYRVLKFEPCSGGPEQQWKWTHMNKTLLAKMKQSS